MSVQITINKSFYDKIDKVKEQIDDELTEFGQKVVAHAVDISPVDTGAYVDSFSVVPRGSSGGRSRSSRNRPRNQPEGPVKTDAKSRLMASVASFEPLETGGFTLINRAPHANKVENGWPSKAGYKVFERTRSYAESLVIE